MPKIIVITSDDEIKVEEYRGYESTRDTVEGFIEHFASLQDDSLARGEKIDAWCNGEFLYSDKESCQKVNPIATLALCDGSPVIYGNVAINIGNIEDGESRGLTDEEVSRIKSALEHVKREMDLDGLIDQMHVDFDNNRVIPPVIIEPWEEEKE